ncbi:MAG: sortase [Chloroflexota bacterium]
MIRIPKLVTITILPRPAPVQDTLDTRAKVFWTAGNALMLLGIIILLYVGGLYATESYGRYAARGDTDVPAPAAVTMPITSEPAPFIPPVLNNQSQTASTSGQIVSAAPAIETIQPSTVSRIAISSIDVDAKVVEVGWDIQEQDGEEFAVWQVAEYAVGHHKGTANPGDGENIVLAGHVGGFGKVFKDLYYVEPGDKITLYSNGEQYLYIVDDIIIVEEESASEEQRAENARLIDPTGHEMVTLVTCWPATGPDRFSERIIVQATPFTPTDTSQFPSQSNWTVR